MSLTHINRQKEEEEKKKKVEEAKNREEDQKKTNSLAERAYKKTTEIDYTLDDIPDLE